MRGSEQKQWQQSGFGAVVADPKALEAQHPGGGAFHDPAGPAQVSLGLNPAPGDPDLDAPPLQVVAGRRWSI